MLKSVNFGGVVSEQMPTLEDLANALTVVEEGIEYGVRMDDAQRANALAGALQGSLNAYNYLLLATDLIPVDVRQSYGLTEDTLMALRSAFLIHEKILNYCAVARG